MIAVVASVLLSVNYLPVSNGKCIVHIIATEVDKQAPSQVISQQQVPSQQQVTLQQHVTQTKQVTSQQQETLNYR